MNWRGVLAGTFLISMAVPTLKYVRTGYVPLPYNYVRIAVSYSVLSMVGVVSEELAGILAIGYLIVLFQKQYRKEQDKRYLFQFMSPGGLLEWLPSPGGANNWGTWVGGVNSNISQQEFDRVTGLFTAAMLKFNNNTTGG